MIVEHEILEQLLHEERSLSWVVSFLEEHHAKPWQIVSALVATGSLALLGADGSLLPEWKVLAMIREEQAAEDVLVRCTAKGASIFT